MLLQTIPLLSCFWSGWISWKPVGKWCAFSLSTWTVAETTKRPGLACYSVVVVSVGRIVDWGIISFCWIVKIVASIEGIVATGDALCRDVNTNYYQTTLNDDCWCFVHWEENILVSMRRELGRSLPKLHFSKQSARLVFWNDYLSRARR